ncbi:MAG: hypothetical protein ABIG89_06670 [Candidatus Woesearchaeota archaeon]
MAETRQQSDRLTRQNFLKGLGALALFLRGDSKLIFGNPDAFYDDYDLEEMLTKDDFSNGELYFSDLDVRIEAEPERYYKEMHVKDIRKAEKEFRLKYFRKNYTGTANPFGWHAIVYNSISKVSGHLTVVEANLDELNDTLMLSHERGHFIWKIGKQYQIYQKFKDPKAIESEIHYEEDFAYLCGFLGYMKAGYDLKTFNPVVKDSSTEYAIEDAKRIISILLNPKYGLK